MPNIFSLIDIDSDQLLLNDQEQEALYVKINRLPPAVEELIFSLNSEEVLKNISQNWNLSSGQSAKLTLLVRGLLLTDVYLGDLVSRIQKELFLDETKSRELANALIEQLLSPALKEIKDLQVEKFGQRKTPGESLPARSLSLEDRAASLPSASQPSAPPNPDRPTIENPHNVINLRKDQKT